MVRFLKLGHQSSHIGNAGVFMQNYIAESSGVSETFHKTLCLKVVRNSNPHKTPGVWYSEAT